MLRSVSFLSSLLFGVALRAFTLAASAALLMLAAAIGAAHPAWLTSSAIRQPRARGMMTVDRGLEVDIMRRRSILVAWAEVST